MKIKEHGAMETTVLFMDDNLTLVEYTSRLLGKMRPEWRFLLANNLAEARRLFTECFTDAAVLDVDLPDGNGLDLLSELKGHCPWLPVIMMSGDDGPDLRRAVVDRGGFAFLGKPFSLSDLVDHIDLALKASRDESPVPLSPSPEASGVWSNPHALVLRPAEQKLAVLVPETARLVSK
jgi:two-component system, NtrC family, nitrogen regulation response regulator GlnG